MLSFLWLFSQLSIADPDKEEVTIADDEWVEVPLDFTFPFYGNTYVTSFMFANGVIGFLDPLNIPGTGIQNDGLCCNSFDFENTAYADMGATYGGNYGGVRFDYVIMPWHTDLIDIGSGKFYIQGDDTFQSYFWENISEYYDQTDLNTFDTTIYPLGNIRFSYQAVDIQSHSVTIAIVGDLSAGQYTQWFYNNPSTDGGVYWTSGTQLPVEIEAGQSICEVDSTASYVCLYYAVGYAEAYYDQQCTANTLYDSGCPGWAAAYLTQQCNISTLYDSACPGYTTAYYNQQCSLDATYDPNCTGYQTAYIDNQCTLDPLYSPSCSGYSAAIAEEEAEASYEDDEFEDDWEEYATFEPETSFDDYFEFETFDSNDFSMPTDTYDTGFEPEFEEFDTSFENIFAELEMEMMEEFEDFSMDMFSEPLEDMEFDMPYMEDFEEMDFDMPSMEDMEMPEIELEPEIETEEMLTEETLEEPEMESELEPEPEEVLDEPSEEVETEEEVEEEPEEESEGDVLDDEQDEQQEEEAEEEDEGSTDEESDEEVEEESEEEVEEEEEESEETMMAESEEEEEPEEELIAEAEIKEPTPEQKKKAKEKKMREIITAKLNSLAKEMGEATSLAQQKELQNFIIALLNFNIGFNSYNSFMVDGLFYVDRDIYKDKKIPENQRGLRNGLANEILHNKLVDIQYEENYGRSRI